MVCGQTWRQFWALMRKNALIKLRLWPTTLAEIFLPILIMAAIAGIRSAIDRTNVPDTHYVGPNSNPSTLQPYAMKDQTAYFNYSQSMESLYQNYLVRFQTNLAFAPAPGAGQDLGNALLAEYPFLAGHVLFFAGEGDIINAVKDPLYKKDPAHPGITAGIILTKIANPSSGEFEWRYTLRMNVTGDQQAVPNTFQVKATDDITLTYKSAYWTQYLNQGFMALQANIETWMLNQVGYNGSTIMTAQPFPSIKHVDDSFADVIKGFLGLLFTLIYMWPVTRVTKVIVEEKELRIKEAMKIMGLSDFVLWFSWFCTYAIVFAISSLGIIIVNGRNVYQYSDKGIIFFYFWLFGMGSFAFCYLIQAFFSRATVASTVAAILFLGSFFPYYAVMDDTSSTGQKTLGCLSVPLCFSLGASTAASLESANQGVTNASIRTKIDNFSFDTTIGMLIFDIIWYLLLGIYLDHVLPSAYGVPLPWNFICTPKWWKASCRSKRKIAPGGRALEMSGVSSVPLPGTGEKVANDPNVEPVGPELEARTGITVSRLRREFKSEREDGAPIVAVDDVSLSMYEGQIFALLGHNGAGKTTIISMLTGMIPASSGDAQIYGQNISTDMASIRDSVGICPQHNILFDLLTVSEHLYLFGRIKGVPAEQLEHEVNTFIRDVGLTEKKDSKAGVLSGGQKRKLSVAIALIGGSRVVFLDEPTSGMDPYSRRSTWEILRHAKEGRVIILTTHFMDEADQLGDRIAIMAHGDVKCCGSSLFLKSRFGVGYTLTVSKSGDSHALHDAITRAVPAAEVLTDVAGEIAFRLPFDASPAFPGLFKNMDENTEKYGILSYGISVTTLEEVFLRVGRDESADQKTRLDDVATFRRQSSANRLAHKHDHDHHHDEKEEKGGAAQGKTGTVYDFNNVNLKNLSTDPVRHVYALLVKRIQIARRDRKVFMWQLFYPFLIMIIGVGLLKLGLSFSYPSIKIDTSPYNTPNRVMWPKFSDVTENAPLGSVFANNVGYGNSISVPYDWNPMVNPYDQSERQQRALNFSIHLLDDWKTYRFKESRYVALCWEFFEPPQASNDFTNRTYIRIFHNTTASASLPVGLNLYHNMIYQQYTNRNPTAKITVLLDPLPRTTDQEALQSSITAVLIAIGLAFIPASFIGQVVREREYKAKHQQFLSGVDVTAYWGSNYAWDFSNYLVTAFVALIVVAIYDIKQLVGENAGATVLTLILFGFACPTFTYAFSFFFSNHTSAQNISLLVFIFSGPMLLIASVILDIIASTRDVNKVLKFFYRLLPHYSVGESLAALIVRKASIATGGVVKGQWDMDVTGWPLLYMALEAIVFFVIVLAIEKVLRTPQWLAKVYPDPSIPIAPFEEDPDIIAERNRVQNNATLDVGTANTPSSRDIIQLRGLRKVYRSRLAAPPKVAVHNVWFGIAPGECFGFLGINGAGKTTSMQMLTGDVIPTAGTAVLDGLDVLTQQRAIRRLIGYCPQFDALFDSMTAREHLTFYSRIKGIPENIIPEYVEAMIQQLDLVEYADQPSKGYSGGNKRKLSVGVALIGNPPIVFLDEPSTGMDPKSRRFMWDLISSTMAGRSVMLTTHSMEECEALCSRIGIMVSGRLRCVGTAQHLKHRYGDGYQVDVSCGTNNTDAVARFVNERLPGAFVIERHPNTAKFRVPKVDSQGRRNTLADLFTLMEHNRKQINVIEYSVSETTLEQIFIHFAKQQEEETGEVAGLTDAAAYAPVGSALPVADILQ